MKEYAKKFYSSKQWQHTREAYKKYVGGLCERCLANGVIKAGELVHHKIHITPTLINEPSVTLDWNNLELLCRDCHLLEHEDEISNGRMINNIKAKQKEERRRYMVNDDGTVVIKHSPSRE